MKQKMQPMTLTAMAGIQLTTGVDVSAADMSGVVPTATTVEELKVPIFIDEGIQVAPPPTLATTTATEIYNCNNNRETTINYSNEEKSDIGEDIFEDLEFDFEDLIVSPAKEVKEQQQSDQLQQLITSDIPLYNNNINNNSNKNYNNNNNINTTKVAENNKNNNSDNMLNTLFLKSEPTISENFDIWEGIDFQKKEEWDMYDECATIKSEQKNYPVDDLIEPQYSLLPGALEDSQITYIDDNEIEMIQNLPLDAVCFENDLKQPDLSDVLTNSEENPLIAGDFPNSQSQSFSQLISAEPIVPEFNELDAATSSGYSTNNNMDAKLLRKRTVSNNKLQGEKRKKLCLNVMQTLPSTSSLNTPDIVNLISEMWGDKAPYTEYTQHSPAEVLHDLFNIDDNNSMSPVSSPSTPYHQNDITDVEDESSPATPLSNYSTSHHTSYSGDFNNTTAPNSPEYSLSSTSRQSFNCSNNDNYHNSNNNDSSTNPGKRKRGRPAKEHSDRPNPKLLQQLSDSERKRLEDRAKNNEASRVSRQKNKQREQVEIEEENGLQERHDQLLKQLAAKEHEVRKLEQALQKKYLEK